MSKKTPNTHVDTCLTLFQDLGDFFSILFDTLGQKAWEDLFENFGGFQAQTALRLLFWVALVRPMMFVVAPDSRLVRIEIDMRAPLGGWYAPIALRVRQSFLNNFLQTGVTPWMPLPGN